MYWRCIAFSIVKKVVDFTYQIYNQKFSKSLKKGTPQKPLKSLTTKLWLISKLIEHGMNIRINGIKLNTEVEKSSGVLNSSQKDDLKGKASNLVSVLITKD